MRRTHPKTEFVLSCTAAVLVSWSAILAQTAPPTPPPVDEGSLKLFQRVYGMVLRDYVEPRPPADVMLGALRGAASSAGPECAYIPPDEVAAYRALSSPSATLPLTVTKDNDFARILSVFPGEDPAVKPGDSLRFIGDRSTYDMTYPQVLEVLRGKAGDKVPCVFMKADAWQSYAVTLTRTLPPVPRWIGLPGGSGALVLPGLEDPAPPEVVKAVGAGKGPVLVDLRGCASDDVRAAFRWAGELMGKSESPARKGPQGVRRDPVTGPGILARRPVRVLVDKTTARGGEVLALALQDAGAVLVGEPTLGWAPYSEDFTLENGGILRLNTAYFLAHDGSPLKDHPLTPDIPFTPKTGDDIEDVVGQALKAQPTAAPKPASSPAPKAGADVR